MKKGIVFLVFIAALVVGCEKESTGGSTSTIDTSSDTDTIPDRLAKRQMHFTFLQTQDATADSLVDNAKIKLYLNFSDFDADTAISVTGTSKLGKLILPGEDDGQAYYYRAIHEVYGETEGSVVNALFDDYYTVTFE